MHALEVAKRNGWTHLWVECDLAWGFYVGSLGIPSLLVSLFEFHQGIILKFLISFVKAIRRWIFFPKWQFMLMWTFGGLIFLIFLFWLIIRIWLEDEHIYLFLSWKVGYGFAFV